jgi:hypothetical protein
MQPEAMNREMKRLSTSHERRAAGQTDTRDSGTAQGALHLEGRADCRDILE